jgi:hypothetical protein
MKPIAAVIFVLLLAGCHPFGMPVCKNGVTYLCYDTICYEQKESKCKDPKEMK